MAVVTSSGDSAATPREWEWSATIESGVSVGTGAKWHGHRVRYRDRGTRRWRSFLLSTSDGSTPTDAAIVQAIEAHVNQ